jgi:hypothetical protein
MDVFDFGKLVHEIFICVVNMGKYFMRNTIAPEYSIEYLETERPSPLSDLVIEKLIQDVLSGNLDRNITDSVYTSFKQEMFEWILKSTLNTITGFDSFNRVDIINGCTQFIDSLYMKGPVQVLNNDYRYHQRLGYAYFKDVGSLIPDIPLIIAMPFPQIGAPHPDMEELLNEAKNKRIDVHVDGAWITCCRGVVFDLSHPSIKSVAISLSKGLGLGWNRIGLRWTRDSKSDSVSIMNDFNMNNRALAMIGLHFLRNLPTDYLWNTHGDRYYKVCNDFNLTPTNSIYLALHNGHPVGVSPLIRYLENADIS